MKSALGMAGWQKPSGVFKDLLSLLCFLALLYLTHGWSLEPGAQTLSEFGLSFRVGVSMAAPKPNLPVKQPEQKEWTPHSPQRKVEEDADWPTLSQ